MQRDSEKGVALLEVLISITLVALFLTGALVYQSRAATDQRQRLDQLLLTEFAQSKIEEWSIGGYAATALSGSTGAGWNWHMLESDALSMKPSSLDNLVVFKQLDVEVWYASRPTFRVSASAIVARRRQ